MPERLMFRAMLGAATVLAGLASGTPASAAGAGDLMDSPVSPIPSHGQVDGAAHALASPLNTPVTGVGAQFGR